MIQTKECLTWQPQAIAHSQSEMYIHLLFKVRYLIPIKTNELLTINN